MWRSKARSKTSNLRTSVCTQANEYLVTLQVFLVGFRVLFGLDFLGRLGWDLLQQAPFTPKHFLFGEFIFQHSVDQFVMYVFKDLASVAMFLSHQIVSGGLAHNVPLLDAHPRSSQADSIGLAVHASLWQ